MFKRMFLKKAIKKWLRAERAYKQAMNELAWFSPYDQRIFCTPDTRDITRDTVCRVITCDPHMGKFSLSCEPLSAMTGKDILVFVDLRPFTGEKKKKKEKPYRTLKDDIDRALDAHL